MKKIEQKNLAPPQQTSGDTAHTIVKVLLTPILGAPELFEKFFAPPLQKRTEEWMKNVVEALRTLKNNQGVAIETLQNNELFITVVTQATRVAIGNHQQEKLEALKNAIVQSAFSSEYADIQTTFVRFIDELTPSHLYLLKLFINEEKDLKKIKSYEEVYILVADKLSSNLLKDEFRMLVGDLSVRGLLRVSRDIGDFEDIYQGDAILAESTKDDLPRIMITDVARKFIRFISAI